VKCIRLFVLPGLLAGLVVAIGCDPVPEVLESEPDFTGFITSISVLGEKDTLAQILVESHADKLVDKYVVSVGGETQVLKQVGEERRRVAFSALGTTQQVQIWFSGPVRGSFPMQGTARQVVITASAEATHLQLAEYWAPVWWQDTDEGNFRADYITNFDFDGDWNPLNNWDSLPHFELKAYIYYWVAETTTHWFIGYADFHPRDWSDDITAPWDQHENDMEGCLLVIQKDDGYYGQFVLMITRAHEGLYSFKDYDNSPSKRAKNGHEDIDGDVEFEANHPHIYVKAEGHAVHGDLRWEQKGFPGEDGVLYRFTGQAEEPQPKFTRNLSVSGRLLRDSGSEGVKA